MRSLACFLLVGILTFGCTTCLVHGIQVGRDDAVDMMLKEPSSDVGEIQRTGRIDGSSKNDADSMSEVYNKSFFPDNYELPSVDDEKNAPLYILSMGQNQNMMVVAFAFLTLIRISH